MESAHPVALTAWDHWIQTHSRFKSLGDEAVKRFESHVPHHLVGYRLDRYLATRFRYLNREAWKNSLSEGLVLVNGEPKKRTHRVALTDHVSFGGQTIEEPPIPTDIPTIFEDHQIAVFDKPAHIPVHHCGKYLKHTLVELMNRQRTDHTIRFLHRLDTETSGVLLASKNADIHRPLYTLFEQDQIHKVYLAVVFGIPDRREWIVNAPIGPAVGSRIHIKLWANDADGLPSETKFSLLASSNRFPLSLLMAEPLTGRTNQIRVHAAVSGHPLVGDKTYHEDEQVFIDYQEKGLSRELIERAGFHRTLLHAWILRFPYNDGKVRGSIQTFTAPVPPDFKWALDKFGVDFRDEWPGRQETDHT